MLTEVVYGPMLDGYRFVPGHPMRPERYSLAMELARRWGLAAGVRMVDPSPASDTDLMLFHTAEYLAAVKAASADPSHADPSFGLGPGDTPAFEGVHEVSSYIAGATIEALEAVVSGRTGRSFSPAGGLHHARRDRASGFCVYNDCAIAIEKAVRDHPGLRVAYIDIDAHHGDGVEAAFFDRADVLTASIHESGRFLFPGTGTRPVDGEGDGAGLAINVPLAPEAGDDEYRDALDDVVAPAVRRFGPHVIVAQLGADSHEGDPLTHLRTTVGGYLDCVRRITALADEVCGGRVAATGGGGYQPFSAVPVMWASALCVLMGVTVPQTIPDEWYTLAADSERRAY